MKRCGASDITFKFVTSTHRMSYLYLGDINLANQPCSRVLHGQCSKKHSQFIHARHVHVILLPFSPHPVLFFAHPKPSFLGKSLLRDDHK